MEAGGPLRDAVIHGMFRSDSSSTFNPWGDFDELMKDGLNLLWILYQGRSRSFASTKDIKLQFKIIFPDLNESTLERKITDAIDFLKNPKGSSSNFKYITVNEHSIKQFRRMENIQDISISREGLAICQLIVRKKLEIQNAKEEIKKRKVKNKTSKSIKTKSDIIIDEKFKDVLGQIDNLKNKVEKDGDGDLSTKLVNMQNEIVITGNSLIKQTEISIIIMMLEIFNKIDPYTAGHQYNVAYLVKNIAKKILKPTEKNYNELLYQYTIAALIHDIGKFTIPISLLTKPGILNKEEKKLINTHPDIGSNLLNSFSFLPLVNIFPQISEIILQHHELLDGSGYPNNLKADEIHRGARIVAVADIVEAMSNHRPYRPFVMSKDEVINIIDKESRGKNKKLDRPVVRACIDILNEPDFAFPISSIHTYDWDMSDEYVKQEIMNFINDVSLS